MITLSSYTNSKILYQYFVFAFFYNLLLSFFLKKKKIVLKVIIFNLFFAMTVYYFGNQNIFINKDILLILKNFIFNMFIVVFISGNWILPFIFHFIVNILKNYK